MNRKTKSKISRKPKSNANKLKHKNFLPNTAKIDVSNIKSFEELRVLQHQLESRLVSLTSKKILIETKINKLENFNLGFPDVKKDKRSRSTDSVEKKNEDKPPKRIKESGGKAHPTSASQTKSKIVLPPCTETYDAPRIQKNDAPSRFWALLEPYCSDITQDTVKALESSIHSAVPVEEYLKIPELGAHFSIKWPLEDIKEDVKEGSKSLENQKGLFEDSKEEEKDGERLLNLAENFCSNDSEGKYSCLAERLICTLVDENLMTPLDESMAEACEDTEDRNEDNVVESPKMSISKQDDSLESRLRRDLFEAGMISDCPSPEFDPRDEVCQELRRLQSTLIPVYESNIKRKKGLLAIAKAEISKRDVKKKLQELDAKVMDTYRTVAAAKKCESINKKMEEQVKRILRERRKLLGKLNNLQ